jgi:hypothetical protein
MVTKNIPPYLKVFKKSLVFTRKKERGKMMRHKKIIIAKGKL